MYEQEFELESDLIYLNHAAVAPWPARTRNAVCQFASENARVGARYYPRWIETETSLRKNLQTLINARHIDDIGLLKNTSEALSVVAYGLDWKKGQNVVISDMEFPSNRIVWESLKQFGVEVRYANLAHTDGHTSEQSLIDICDENTRLLSISSVQYSNGLSLDLKTLSEFCNSQEILFCVDAIQSIGAMEFDVQKLDVDFAMADGHKWMLGPEGVALFYCKPQLREKLQLHQFGWHMTEDYLNFDQTQWHIAHSARRFECGSPNMLGIHGLNASLSLILEVGIKTIQSEILKRAQLAKEAIINSKQLVLLTPDNSKSGIITFKHHRHETEKVFKQLSGQNVVCANRGGGIRFSPHFYSSKEQLIKAIQLAEEL